MNDDLRWTALCERDAAAGFVYGVATTGVYCRPSCASRRPNRGNVRFFDHPSDAEAAGFRPCKRCAPHQDAHDKDAALLTRLCALIDQAEEEPSLEALATAANLSPGHLHRLFKARLGVTPKQYAAARRRSRLQQGLPQAGSVTEAIFDAGFNTASRFYENSAELLGMSAARYRRGGGGERIRYATAPCSLGHVLVAATERGICAIELGDDASSLENILRRRLPQAELATDDAFGDLLHAAVALVDDPLHAKPLPLDVRGTAFQQRVWSALQAIPPGQTVCYAELAEQLGMPKAARAVGRAIGSNSIAVAIPCHRVIGRDGSLTGYRWGTERKRALLERERE